MQNDHTQPPNIIRKTRICYVQLARTCSRYRVEKAEGMILRGPRAADQLTVGSLWCGLLGPPNHRVLVLSGFSGECSRYSRHAADGSHYTLFQTGIVIP